MEDEEILSKLSELNSSIQTIRNFADEANFRLASLYEDIRNLDENEDDI